MIAAQVYGEQTDEPLRCTFSGGETAASLREGLEEMFTVARLGIDGRLAKTLTTSNPVESIISIAMATNRNVTRWRDGRMVLCWTAAGMAERLGASRAKMSSRLPPSSRVDAPTSVSNFANRCDA